MATQDIFQSVYSLLLILTLLSGLWLAWRLLRHLSSILPWLTPDLESESHWPFLVVWLILGGLFAAPFTDLVLIIQKTFTFVMPTFSGTSLGDIVSFWGSVPVQLDSILTISLMVVLYFLACRLGIAVYRSGKLAFLDSLGLERLDQSMILLAFASLFTHVVHDFVYRLVWFQFPGNPYRGVLGYLIGWIIAVILIAMILVFMDRQLFKLEDELDDPD
jgi:hypothetical protein